MGLWIKNAYLHVGKNTDWSKWRNIFSREVAFCKGMLPIENECILFLHKECYTLWMKVSVCKACSCHLELVLQEKDACLIISCSHLQCFHCLFQVWGKNPKLNDLFMWVELLLTLQRGWGTWRYANYCKLYLRHSLEGVRTKIARIVLRHSAAWRNALRMHSSPKLKPKIQELRRSLGKSWNSDLPQYPYQSLSKFFRNPRFWSGVLWESWILNLGFCKECILIAFLQNANCPKYKEESKSTFCLLPSVCVYSHMCIYIYMGYPLEEKQIPKTLQNCPFKTISKNRHETPHIPVKVMRR